MKPSYVALGEMLLDGGKLEAEDWKDLGKMANYIVYTQYPNVPRADQKDVVQEVLILVFEKLSSFLTADCAFSTWFYNQVKTAALNWIRRLNTLKRGTRYAEKTVSLDDETEVEREPDLQELQAESDATDGLENQELLEAVRGQLDQHPDYRLTQIFDMRACGIPGREIARWLQTSPQRVSQLESKIAEITTSACA